MTLDTKIKSIIPDYDRKCVHHGAHIISIELPSPFLKELGSHLITLKLWGNNEVLSHTNSESLLTAFKLTNVNRQTHLRVMITYLYYLIFHSHGKSDRIKTALYLA